MRKITTHCVNELNENLELTVLDEPAQGGANHEYQIVLNDGKSAQKSWNISFQNGPIKEAGFNGLSSECLLAICIDRLRSFQAGPFSCRDNALALTHLEESLMWLQKRTRDRMLRGVEGTNTK